MISAIVAVAKNGIIGKEGGIPWYLPADLTHFKQITMGHPIIMGRATHESIGKALPGRTNIVLTHDSNYKAEGCRVVQSIDKAIELAKSLDDKEIFIIGGEQIYNQAMSELDRIYMTAVDADIKGDKIFQYDDSGWEQVAVEKHSPDDKNPYPYEFQILERKKS